MKNETLKLRMMFSTGGYRVYPNNELSKIFTKLAKVKTFTKTDLELIR